MALPATDNFNRADNTTLGTNWTPTHQTPGGAEAGIAGNQAINTANTVELEYWNADSFNNDQSSTATISTWTPATGGPIELGVSVRVNNTSGGNGLWFYGYAATGRYMWCSVRNGSTQSTTTFATTPTIASGDVIQVAVVGTTYYFSVNGHVIGVATNSSFASGSAGLWFGSGPYNNVGRDRRLDNWIGDNQSAFPPPSPLSLNVPNAPRGATFNLTINGTGFQGIAPTISGRNPTVAFSGTGITVNSLSVVTNTQIVVNITLASNATLSTRDITITNLDTQTGVLASSFTVMPVFAALAPSDIDIQQVAGVLNQLNQL